MRVAAGVRPASPRKRCRLPRERRTVQAAPVGCTATSKRLRHIDPDVHIR